MGQTSDPWRAFAQSMAQAFDLLVDAAVAACRQIAAALDPLRRMLVRLSAWRIEHRSEIWRIRRRLARRDSAPGRRRAIQVPEAVAWLALAAGQR